jgi:hypothetical protein
MEEKMQFKQKRYVFKEPYTNEYGTIPLNSEITVLGNVMYFNGGLCDNYSQGLFKYIINNENLKKKYLKEVAVINNEI